jgi:hypothetical protein
MTTIATKDGIVACDSQLTGDFMGKAQKIHVGDGVIVGYCGDLIASEHLVKIYLSGEDVDQKKDIDKDDDIELMVVKKSGVYILDKWLREARICGKQFAIGSGSQAAMVAMNMGATPKEAIKEAMKVDPYTGGKIREYRLG